MSIEELNGNVLMIVDRIYESRMLFTGHCWRNKQEAMYQLSEYNSGNDQELRRHEPSLINS